MKIEIYLNWEEVGETRDMIKPHASFKIDIQEEELETLNKKNREIFQAISRLINFSVQFMQ